MNRFASADMILEAANGNPSGFLEFDFNNPRTSKNSANMYHDVKYVLKNGEKKAAGITWSGVKLEGGIKPLDERKYDPTLLFRQSSGSLGAALCKTYCEYSRVIDSMKNTSIIKLKSSKSIVRTIVQSELECGDKLDDPMARLKLTFNAKTNKPEFKVVKIVEVNGRPTSVPVVVTKENIHTIIRSRMITSGYARFDNLVYSNFGISMPAKVELLVIKPLEDNIPAAEDILDEEQMLMMMVPKSSVDDEAVVDDETVADNGEVEAVADDDEEEVESVEEKLKRLQLAAN
jgi:hypothetical protein